MLHDDQCFVDPKETNRDVLSALRKESLDIYNRLQSIEEDIGFVNHVHNHYSDFPLLPNMRCGSWYTDPTCAEETPVYFKSTDGHTNNWDFNLRRANLHILPLVAEKRGILLVDSTRSGKRMPDALSKTVPIWCAVINRAIAARRRHAGHYHQASEWDTGLYTPPGVVSGQEHDQIMQKLGNWADALAKSSFDLPLDLQAPLRPVWISPSTASFPILDSNSTSSVFLPIICVCASKQVEAGAERRIAGYVYVQGSGDDHELWGRGLTPQLFWRHHSDLVSCPRTDLESLIRQIVSSPSPPVSLVSFDGGPPPTPIQKINGRIRLATFSPSNLDAVLASRDPNTASIVLSFSSPPNVGESLHSPDVSPNATPPDNILHIQAGPRAKAKFNAYLLEYILPTAVRFIQSHLSTKASKTVYILEGCGNEPGTRLDISVGIALIAIQLFFNENGEWLGGSDRPQVDKKSIRTRLEWIISSEPRANPSRSTLKRINEYLLTPSRYRNTLIVTHASIIKTAK